MDYDNDGLKKGFVVFAICMVLFGAFTALKIIAHNISVIGNVIEYDMEDELEKVCITEGGYMPMVPNASTCCRGLIMIPNMRVSAEGTCIKVLGSSPCTKCGDGKCGSAENKCNCPQDCSSNRVCTSSRECEERLGGNYFCDFEEGQCEGIGRCEEKKDSCEFLYRVVCGCDGRTYISECLMNQNGVSKYHSGSCISVSTTTTIPISALKECTDDSECIEGYFCDHPDGECDDEGECVERTNGCIGSYEPVCGCDGRNYANECLLQSNGQSKLKDGLCSA